MGLFTAYFAAQSGASVVVLEESTVGDPMTASFGKTRSYRNDYLDVRYARLAYEARKLWREFERETGTDVLVECGCLNIASAAVTPDLDSVYAIGADKTLQSIGLKRESFDKADVQQKWPQFDIDLARLDVEAGFVDVQAVLRTLRSALAVAGVQINENAAVTAIAHEGDTYTLATQGGEVLAAKIVVTAGHGTNDVLSMLGSDIQFPITKDRPSEAKYVIPPADRTEEFVPANFPVFAYLDIGIYGHPIYEGTKGGLKIGYYNPPDVVTQHTVVHDVRSFVELCMPSLADFEFVDVEEVDQCFYDLVEDDEFILGPLPDAAGVTVGVGWRGTGYKYAPWVGRTLAQVALQGGSVYDIARFDPARFSPTTR